MADKSFHFTHAICRMPSRSLVNGLRAEDIGNPDYELFLKDHADYVVALKEAGVEVHMLDALEAFPDSVFVEDAALCLQEGAVIMRPGAPSRLGEAEKIKPAIEALYPIVKQIKGPGFIEGGDVLTTETEILVGKSARTNSDGIKELEDCVKPWGYTVREVQTPQDILHFKTDCSLLDGKTILSTKNLANTGCFEDYDVIEVCEGEEACANTIRVNDKVIMPEGFPKTQQLLKANGYDIIAVGNKQAAKLDGGMSCLSLRFSIERLGKAR